jgi:hypothetical protein
MNVLQNIIRFVKLIHTNQVGGCGVAVATGDAITATKMNLKLETVAGTDLDAGASTSRVMLFNTFICPAPGTDWTPQLEGCGLAASKTTKKCWIPLSGLKVGDIITTYNLVGDCTEAAALTLDCKIVRVNKADPLTTTDLTNGAITQITADGNIDSAANVDDATVATDKQYVLEILGTTGVGDTITLMGAEVTVTRLL